MNFVSLRLPGAALGLTTAAAVFFMVSCGEKEVGNTKDDATSGPGGSKSQTPGPGGEPAAGNPPTKSDRSPQQPNASPMTTTDSGLQYTVLKEGDGPMPGPSDRVTVHYHGTLEDGTVFDSSVDRNQPATFPVNGVIKGWVEGLQLMKVGSKYKFVIPPDLAYGERGAGGKIGPDATLVFEVELLKIE